MASKLNKAIHDLTREQVFQGGIGSDGAMYQQAVNDFRR